MLFPKIDYHEFADHIPKIFFQSSARIALETLQATEDKTFRVSSHLMKAQFSLKLKTEKNYNKYDVHVVNDDVVEIDVVLLSLLLMLLGLLLLLLF